MEKQQQGKNPIITLSKFRNLLFEPAIPLEVIEDYKGEPMSKIMPYWRKRGLVPFIPVGKHRVEISSADLIWIMMLDIMRKFSYPIEMQEKVRDYFFADAYRDKVPEKNFRYNQRELKKKKLAGTIDSNELATLKFIEYHLQDPKMLDAQRFEINYLTNLIIDCLESGEDRVILIFGDGMVGEQHVNVYYNHNGAIINPVEPHLAISIKYLLREFIHDQELSQMVIPQLLNEDELRVLRAMKEKNVRGITITFSGQKKMQIDVTKTRVISGEEAQKIKEILGLRNYESITLDTMDEKTLSFKKTRKHIKK